MGREPTIKLMLNAEDPVTLQRLITYYGYLNTARQGEIKHYRHSIENLEQTRRDILVKNQNLILSRNRLAKAREDLQAQRQQRADALAKLNKSLNYKQNKLVRMERDQQQLEQLIKEVERTIATLELEAGPEPFKQQRGKLPWPARGIRQSDIRATVNNLPRSPGIFLQTEINEPVRAVHHGRVVFADWLRGFGLLMILDHGDNYMSLYGFNEALLKNTGDWVKSGETIASTGNSGGQTQSGLYFEIRHRGKPDNPLKWLQK